MPVDNSYLQYNKILDTSKKYQFHVSKISGNSDLNIDASNLVIDASLISLNSDIDLSGNIIPTINETFDLGTPEFRFRDLFLSNASIWFGDENKISINSDGKFSSKKRNTDIIPAFISNHQYGHDNTTDLLNYYFGSGHSKTISDMKLKDWKSYTIRRGIKTRKNFDIGEVFSDSTSDDWESIEEGINESDLLTSLSNLNIDICNNNFDFSGNLIVNGDISATTFYGDGSNLTGITSGASLNNFSDANLGNVQISGNLLMNGRINFFASNEQLAASDASGILNRIDNLLTSNNDASFGNVDITGNLNVDSQNNTIGKLKLSQSYITNVDFSNVNINYGLRIRKNGKVTLNSSNTGDIQFRHENNNSMTIDSTGKVGIGTTNPTQLLQVNGNIYSTGQISLANIGNSMGFGYYLYDTNWTLRLAAPSSNYGSLHTADYIYSDGGYQQSSDDNLKSYSENIDNALDLLNQLKPKRYKKHKYLYTSDETPDLSGIKYKTEIGLIAQEIETIEYLKHTVSECIFYTENGGNIISDDGINLQTNKTVNYIEFIPLCIKGIKELKTIVENEKQIQETKISNLEIENNLLKSKLNEILSEMGKQNI